IARHLLLQVEAGGKAAASAVQDEDAQRGVGLERIHRVLDLEEHALSERVDALGAVKLELRDRAVGAEADGFVGFHGSSTGRSSPAVRPSSRGTTSAWMRSPRRSSGRPTASVAAIFGCALHANSISSGDTLLPLR